MIEDFKARMKRIRIRAGFKSQQMAADAIGCPRGTVGMWEAPSSPVQSIGNEWLFEVARVYQVHPAWINKLDSNNDGFPWQPMTGTHLAAFTEEVAPSFARLLTAANIDQSAPISQAGIARELGIDPATVAAWRRNGVSKDGADFAEAKFGVLASWILYGEGMKLISDQQSHTTRLDAETLADAIAVIQGAAELRGVTPLLSPRAIAIAYALLADAGERASPTNMVRLVKAFMAKEGESDVPSA